MQIWLHTLLTCGTDDNCQRNVWKWLQLCFINGNHGNYSHLVVAAGLVKPRMSVSQTRPAEEVEVESAMTKQKATPALYIRQLSGTPQHYYPICILRSSDDKNKQNI